MKRKQNKMYHCFDVGTSYDEYTKDITLNLQYDFVTQYDIALYCCNVLSVSAQAGLAF